MKKPFHFSSIFKRFLSFDLEDRNSSNSFYRSTNYLQIKVWAPDGRIICGSKFNLPIQDLCADQSSIWRWKNYLQIKEPSADQRLICNWFGTDFQLQLTATAICNWWVHQQNFIIATTCRLTWQISRLLSNYGILFLVSIFTFIARPPCGTVLWFWICPSILSFVRNALFSKSAPEFF